MDTFVSVRQQTNYLHPQMEDESEIFTGNYGNLTNNKLIVSYYNKHRSMITYESATAVTDDCTRAASSRTNAQKVSRHTFRVIVIYIITAYCDVIMTDCHQINYHVTR